LIGMYSKISPGYRNVSNASRLGEINRLDAGLLIAAATASELAEAFDGFCSVFSVLYSVSRRLVSYTSK
jgi:hypothetical protein